MVGAGCRRGSAGAPAARPGPANASPISAPLPAARPPSSRRPAPKSLAVDRSAKRLVRLEQNLARLNLKAETTAPSPPRSSTSAPFDAILLDAPCSATGTIRRHPDVAWTKGEDDLRKLDGLADAASSTGRRAC